MAAALATIASHLVARVFTPVYIPTLNDGIRDLLLRYADANCQKEVTCRALFLSAYTADEQRKTVKIIVREVTGTVSEILGLLINPSILNAFRTELSTLFQNAMILWRGAQYATVKFDITIQNTEESDWGILGDPDGNEESAAESQPALPIPRNFVMLALFPRIMIVREEIDKVIFGGIALWNWQAAAAAQKLREDIKVKRSKREASRKERKMTINGNGSVPTSLTKLKGTPFLR